MVKSAGDQNVKAPMPLAELHCHIEGTVAPELALKLAARHEADLSHIIAPQGSYIWSTFPEFLKVYDEVSSVVRTPEDYYDLVYDYLAKAAAEGMIYSEMFISSEHPEAVGISYQTFLDAVDRAFADIEAAFGLKGVLILTAIRHLGAERAERTAAMAERHPHPRVVGFGLAGDESLYQPSDFARAYEMASNAGLKKTVHAGEVEGPESIRAALEALQPDRLGHGVRVLEDADLMADLIERQMPFELCPSSNVAIGIFPSLKDHPIADYLKAGLKATLSTDDPPFFFTTIGAEYARVAAAHDLTEAQMLTFTRNSIETAFCDHGTKLELLAKVDAWAADTLSG